MCRLTHVLGVEGGAKTEGRTRAELDIVGQGEDAALVNLALYVVSLLLFSLSLYLLAYLCEAAWVKLVFACNLHPDIRACIAVPRSLRASLNSRVDVVVVACAEHAQVVRAGNSRSVGSSAVAKRSRVLGHGCLLDIVAALDTSDEALVADGGVDCRDLFEEVDEGAGVDIGLLEV